MSSYYLDLPVGTANGNRIITAGEVLSWSGATSEAFGIHRDYVLLLGERLGAILATVGGSAIENRLRSALDELSDDAWVRLVSSPRSSYMLLWPSRHEAAATASFLADAAEVELARAGSVSASGNDAGEPGNEARWSALGDGWLDKDGQFVATPTIANFAPIDVASPHALSIDLEGAVDTTADPRQPLSISDVSTVLARLVDVQERLATTNQELLDFVATFTKVLVLQCDHQAPKLFSTGSSAQYVGRSVFGNPHLEIVDAALLAEGLVHEAIHSLLYMSERLEPWVTSAELYGPEQRTKSVWTGNPLPLRSYLQACFVWYGLAQFWCQALSATAFPADRARARVIQSVRGFLNGEMLGQIESYRSGIAPEVLETIEVLESNIVEAANAVV